MSLNRQRAAANNNCRAIIAYFDLEQYTKTSPEMKEAIKTLELIRAGGCKCGNMNPKERYAACGTHLACEECYQDKDKVADRRGNCNFPGCNCKIAWPPIRVQAFEKVQCIAIEGFRKLEHALQIEEQRDDEGERRRAAALGREIGEEPDPAPAGGLEGPLEEPPAQPRRGPKRRADYSDEEWAEIAEERAAKKRQKAENNRMIAEFPELEAKNAELNDEVSRLRAILDREGMAY